MLLVDDDESVRRTCAALLAKHATVDHAADVSQALELLRSTPFDALCTDYRMPGRNGLDLIRETAVLQPDLQMILVTAYAEFAERDRKETAPPYNLLLKPYEPAKLREAVAKAVEGTQLRRTLRGISSRLDKIRTTA